MKKAHATRCVTLTADKMPCYGDRIEVAGLPETDFYRINLTDADWRLLKSGGFSIGHAKRVAIADLLTDGQSRPRTRRGERSRRCTNQGRTS